MLFRSQTLSNSNSSSSINSQRSHPQQHPQHQHQGQGQHRQASPHGPDPYSLGGQFQTYSAQYPTYRPYTPTTPTTPTTLHGIAIPTTPTFPVSPRLEHSASFSSQGKPASTSGGLFPYAKSQRGTSTRRVPSSESSLYDPYRSRQSGVSASRVKNGKSLARMVCDIGQARSADGVAFNSRVSFAGAAMIRIALFLSTSLVLWLH